MWFTHKPPAQLSLGSVTCLLQLPSCACFDGYTGFDCYKRQCPLGPPWVGFASATDDIRSTATECSGRGKCNQDSGRCECDPGFLGHACNRLGVGCSTTNNCSGHGRCLSMRQVAAMRNDYNLFYSTTYTTPWDAERIFGCVCDYGYAGVSCAQPSCPYGDDPITTGQVDEVQALSCRCASCVGTFTLGFRGETTRALDVQTETVATLTTALEALSTIHFVTVSFDGGTMLCDSDGVSTLIAFTHEHGDVPALVITSAVVGFSGADQLTLQTGAGDRQSDLLRSHDATFIRQ